MDAGVVEAGNYWVVRQGVDEVRDPEGAPAVSMAAYLVKTGQEDLFREISIYGERGETRDEVRRLYLNAVAMRVWRDMGQVPQVAGRRHRPPVTAALVFGVPFSE